MCLQRTLAFVSEVYSHKVFLGITVPRKVLCYCFLEYYQLVLSMSNVLRKNVSHTRIGD